MRAGAPAVTYPAGRSARLAGALAALWLTGAAAVFWAIFSGPALVDQALAAIVLLVFVALSGWGCLAFWRAQTARLLTWDGERWLVQPAVGAQLADGARPLIKLDLQRFMLLGLPRADSRRLLWLWAEAAHDPARWHLLRCALYSFASPAASDAADAGAPGA